MDDLIKRQDAIYAIEKLISQRYGWKTDARDEIQGLHAALCAIIDLPSAQKTGKWIIFPPFIEEICMCSNCKTKFKEAYQHRDTCPSCGARMDA